ncbi:MAG: hypothetical protein M1817_003342 [Caeruleum heppii]|nr:MAG: hypothetical protein M1817_003342 [Caeruleum heppii]
MEYQKSNNRPGSSIPTKRSANTQEAEWVAQEDVFVLKQAKKKAEIRVREGRARPIDWLAVTLRALDPNRDLLEEDVAESDIDIVDPDGVFEGLGEGQLHDLERDICTYLTLETTADNRDYWNTMKIICKDRRQKTAAMVPEGRAVSSVAKDVDRLLGPKSYADLEILEKQIIKKLNSNEPIDVDYWEQLLQSLRVWKAKAKLRNVYQVLIDKRLDKVRKQQEEEAENVRKKMYLILTGLPSKSNMIASEAVPVLPDALQSNDLSKRMDPDPLLKIRAEDKGLETVDERLFLQNVTAERRKVLKLGYVPMKQRAQEKPPALLASKPQEDAAPGTARFAAVSAPANDDFSQATKALYEREVARGVNEDEEIFAGEEEVSTRSKPQWVGKYRPRKPRYFNRVQMGYEWNKYNQTHYDHDNPPPKVVQGYKFNIFYPDLIDKTVAPTYRIEREHGRKKGQSFAPAGEEDTCLIRFIAGPPYEDVAFRIVDREWDYSAKRERGFRSSFDKVRQPQEAALGILQLHFQFKKIYYRK